MYLHLSDNMESAIVRCVAEQPSLTAKQICECLARRRCRASRSSVYEKLKRLEDNGVVVKMNRGFTVDLAWASELLVFATDLRARYLDHAQSSGLWAAPGDKRAWRFRSLRDLCEFWPHLYLALATASRDRHFLDWSPYLLFDLACNLLGPKGDRIRAALGRLGGHGFRIYDDALPLNRLLAQQTPAFPLTAASAASPYHRHERTILHVLGEFLVTVQLDDRAILVLDELFSTSQTPEPSAVARSLDGPAKVKLRLERDRRKTQSHRRRFAAYFGVKL
jgi:hypothetical protein